MKYGLKNNIFLGVLVFFLFFAAGIVAESEAIPLPNITLGFEDANDPEKVSSAFGNQWFGFA